jgi:pimeloyl-ACP methyl ester carboxylesterase
MSDYVICARNIKGGKFASEPAPSTYLAIDGDAAPRPVKEQTLSSATWAKRVIAAGRVGVPKNQQGNILVFVHGFNNDQDVIMQRHRRLRDDLQAAQFRGVVVSFDWPSGNVGAFYLEDLVDANHSALNLVKDGILLLAGLQQPDCPVNIHILAHSMGAYVTREAFTAADDADDLTGKTWRVNQVMLIAGDISSRSLGAGDHRIQGLYRNCGRLTNYSSRHDNVLTVSNVKRAGVAPRAGRVGLPDDAPGLAVDVDCTDYYSTIPPAQPVIGSREHSWHIGDPTFTQDMIDTMNGVDRDVRPTRSQISENRFKLKRP